MTAAGPRRAIHFPPPVATHTLANLESPDAFACRISVCRFNAWDGIATNVRDVYSKYPKLASNSQYAADQDPLALLPWTC